MTPPGKAALRFEGVSHTYRTPARTVEALRDVNLHCPPGGVTCVVGPSGCGKTTLLRLAAGLENPTAGSVRLGEQAIAAPRPEVGMISQEGTLLPWRKVLANVTLGLEIRGTARRVRIRRAMEALRTLGLSRSVAGSYPHELSGGMRQRVALAQMLCTAPEVLLMDEPFAALDEPTRYRLQEQLLELWKTTHRTILFVTHSLEEAVYLADRLVVLTDGRVHAVEDLCLPRPRDRFGEELVGVLRRLRERLGSADLSPSRSA